MQFCGSVHICRKNRKQCVVLHGINLISWFNKEVYPGAQHFYSLFLLKIYHQFLITCVQLYADDIFTSKPDLPQIQASLFSCVIPCNVQCFTSISKLLHTCCLPLNSYSRFLTIVMLSIKTHFNHTLYTAYNRLCRFVLRCPFSQSSLYNVWCT